MTETERCPCGQDLHYTSAAQEHAVRQLISLYGASVKVRSPYGAWHVPRHWIALHGLRTEDIPELASHYGWPRQA